jgi:beta-glucanase (GH16 family)
MHQYRRASRVAALWVAAGAGAALFVDPSRTASSPLEELDLSTYKLTFSEEFDDLSVSAWGPGTRWIAHTPWKGDFGDAQFVNPVGDFPFTVENGVLRIEARRGTDGKWRSGLLSTVDARGNGFAQQYGYFEMRAKLPTGPGVWPAFWLVGVNWAGRGASKTTAEIDILEFYGPVSADWYSSVVHVWYHDGSGRKYNIGNKNKILAGTRFDEYHTYGVRVRPDEITFYFDRVEVWKAPALPPEYQQPMMILVNLALGSGYPIDQTPDPSYMFVDYVRAYSE